jgi:hypothetical protein
MTRTTHKIVGGLTFFGVIVGGMANYQALADMQPFATKYELASSVDTMRWANLATKIDNMQDRLERKNFEAIQLDTLIQNNPDDPGDTKKKFKAQLDADIKEIDKRLEQMRCLWEQRDNPELTC